jgi:transposase-like protein
MAAKKKKTRRTFSTETKEAAVAALNAGTAGEKIEKRFKVAVAQVYTWRAAGFGKGSTQRTVHAGSNGSKPSRIKGKTTDAPDVLLALNLDESVRLIVRDELTQLAELRAKGLRP